MPSDLHKALVALFRDRPTLAPELLQTALGVSVPAYQRVRVVDAKLGRLPPIQFEADLVLELEATHTVLSVILEVQLDYKRAKKFSWPSYVTNLEARTQQPACLLVVAPDEGLAAWCRQPIEFGLGSGVFTPRVLGPSAVPVVTDRAAARRAPELAVLSALAHGNAPQGDLVITAMLGGVGALDEARRDFYLNLVATQLNAAARAALEARMATGQADGELIDFMGQVKARIARETEAQLAPVLEARLAPVLEARGEARALLTLLAARGLPVSDAVRAQIVTCTDMATLDRWIARAATATTADQVVAAE